LVQGACRSLHRMSPGRSTRGVDPLTQVLGLDIGTSAVKAVLWDTASGASWSARSAPVRMQDPAPGWWEQDPEDWLRATAQAVGHLRARIGGTLAPEVIALSGQMHGAVLATGDGRAVRPAILWPDRRAAQEAEAIASAVGRERLFTLTGSAANASAVLPKLLWLGRHEAGSLERADGVVAPKDWVRLRLGGSLATEPTDASGTGMFAVATLRWEESLLSACSLPSRLLPPLLASAGFDGRLTPGPAAALGLTAGIPLVAGAGDLPAALLAASPRGEGEPVLNFGSAGQVAHVVGATGAGPPGTQTFVHPDPRRRVVVAALLAAGLAVEWAEGRLGGAPALPPALVPALLFLPHLAGERWPVPDPRVRGAWIGLALETSAPEMAAAARYGVALAYREALEHVLGDLEPRGTPLVLAETHGAREWAQRCANALGRDVALFQGPSPSASGACLLAAVAAGVVPWDRPLGTRERVRCQPGPTRRLQALYPLYRHLRLSLRQVDAALAGLASPEPTGDAGSAV
jgi:xylulokinase